MTVACPSSLLHCPGYLNDELYQGSQPIILKQGELLAV